MPTRRFSNRTFAHHKVIGTPNNLEDLSLDRCEFEGGGLAQYDDPTCTGLRVRNVRLHRCKVGNAGIHGVLFDNVEVNGLRNNSLIHAEAVLFRHVTLAGPIGQIMVMSANGALPPGTRAAFQAAAVEFYATGDWALDISRARFSHAEFTHVPGHLIRRDTDTQFLVHKQAASEVEPDSLPGYARIIVERALRSPWDSMVAIAAPRSKHFESRLHELRLLRARGIAD